MSSSVFELLESRFGTSGESGASFTRRFMVVATVDAQGNINEPADWDPRTDSGLEQKAQFGTEFPALRGALCRSYTLVEKIGTNLFIVDALYDVPTATDPGWGGGWTVSIAGSLGTDFTDVERLTPQEIADGKEPKIVGPYAYKRVEGQKTLPSADDNVFFTVTGSDAKDVELFVPRRENKLQRKVVGMEYYPPVATVTCVKRFEEAEVLRSMKILNHLGVVNSEDVNIEGRAFFFRGQLMLTDAPGIDEVRTTSKTKPIAQVVTLVFSARMDSWQYQTVHTYSDENEATLNAAIVRYKQNNPEPGDKIRNVEEEFRRQPWGNLNDFMSGL